MVRGVLVQWASNFLGVILAVALLDPHIALPPSGTQDYWSTVALFVTVFTGLNIVVRPLLYILLGPLTCLVMLLTLGIAHFLIGVVMFWLADLFVDAVFVESLGHTLLGALIVGGVGTIGSIVLGRKRP